MQQMTKQQKIDVSQNIRGAISDLTMVMESIALNGTTSTKTLESAKYKVEEAMMHINGELS